MIDSIVTAALLGFFAGAIPGPYTTVVASTALERGFRSGARLALIPLVTDIPPMVLTALLLERVNYDMLTGVGVLGGAAIMYLGVRSFRRQGQELTEISHRGEEKRTFWTLAAGGMLSPAPWIFWLVAASPLLLRAWNDSWMEGVLFAATLFVMLIGTATGLAWAASHGRRVLDERRRRKVLKAVGVLLVLVGWVMVWQSYEGNFQRMIQRQEELRERVGPTAARAGLPAQAGAEVAPSGGSSSSTSRM